MSKVKRRKRSTPSIDYQLPEYGFGDFLSKVKDAGLGILDGGLGTIGLGNIIKDSAYSDPRFAEAANKTSEIRNAVVNALPGIGQINKGLQSAGTSITGEDNTEEKKLAEQLALKNPNIIMRTTSPTYKPVYGRGGKLPMHPDGGAVTGAKKKVVTDSIYQSYKDPFTGKPFWVVERNETNKSNPDLFPFDLNEAGSNILYGTYTPPKGIDSNYITSNFKNYTEDNVAKLATPSSNLFKLYWGENPYSDRTQLANPELLKDERRNAYYSLDNPQKATGGFIDYNNRGSKHSQGGIPVDAMGNYSTNPVAEVEKGESVYTTPDKESYVMSDQLIFSKGKEGKISTFADESRKIHNRYKKRLEHDKISQEGYHRDMQNLMAKQEEVRSGLALHSTGQKGGLDESQYIEPNGPEDYLSTKPLTAISGVIDNPIERPEISSTANINSTGDTDYTGSISPVGMITSVAGNLALMSRNKRNKPKDISFERITPEQVNLEAARTALKEDAVRSRANTFSALRRSGANAGQYMANAVTATGEIDRNLGAGLTSSYLNEQLENAKFNQQAKAQNAEMDLQAGIYNQMNDQQFQAEQNQYLANAISAVPQYLRDLEASKNSALLASMTAPNYTLVEDPGQTWLDKSIKGKRFKIKAR